jgi:hypothetical protein
MTFWMLSGIDEIAADWPLSGVPEFFDGIPEKEAQKIIMAAEMPSIDKIFIFIYVF